MWVTTASPAGAAAPVRDRCRRSKHCQQDHVGDRDPALWIIDLRGERQMAFCYLDAGSVRHQACRRAMTTTDGEIAYRHRHEHVLAAAANFDDAGSARAWLDLAAGLPPVHDGTLAHEASRGRVHPAEGDPRIRDAIAILHDLHPHTAVSAAHLAAVVGLSPSRFLHLFRDYTGTSFRRYRLWLRMLRAAELIRDRADLTTAATGAGFASPSQPPRALQSTNFPGRRPVPAVLEPREPRHRPSPRGRRSRRPQR